MITMALHGEGEPQPTLLQVATQAATIELFTQWQTYRNGVHMDWDTFRSVDFRAIAVAVLTASGWEFTANEVPDMPKLRKLLTQPSVFGTTAREAQVQEIIDELDGKTVKEQVAQHVADARERNAEHQRPYGLSAEAIAEHGKQVQG